MILSRGVYSGFSGLSVNTREGNARGGSAVMDVDLPCQQVEETATATVSVVKAKLSPQDPQGRPAVSKVRFSR